MSTKIKDPDDILSEMEEPIRTIRGGHDALVSLGDGGSDVTTQSIQFMADGLGSAVRRLDALWREWADQQKDPNSVVGKAER